MNEATKPCAVCQKPTSKRCGGCKEVHYCSEAHSVQDWKNHKGQCKGITALLFPVHEDEPRLVNVTYKIKKDEFTGEEQQVPDFSPWLSLQSIGHESINSYGMKGRGRALGRTLFMVFNDNYIAEKSPVNQCVQALTAGEAEKWGDNILVFRPNEPNGFFNAKMEDVEPMVAFFKDYNWKNLGYASPEAAEKLSIQMVDPSTFL